MLTGQNGVQDISWYRCYLFIYLFYLKKLQNVDEKNYLNSLKIQEKTTQQAINILGTAIQFVTLSSALNVYDRFVIKRSSPLTI